MDVYWVIPKGELSISNLVEKSNVGDISMSGGLHSPNLCAAVVCIDGFAGLPVPPFAVVSFVVVVVVVVGVRGDRLHNMALVSRSESI